jgi:hypothetical protein
VEGEVSLYFPEEKQDSRQREFLAGLKNRTLLALRKIQGEDVQQQIDRIDGYLLTVYPPKDWTGKDGYEVQYIKSFEEVCILLSSQLNRNPKELTAFEFLQALSTIRKQAKEAKKKQKKRS